MLLSNTAVGTVDKKKPGKVKGHSTHTYFRYICVSEAPRTTLGVGPEPIKNGRVAAS